ncbi:MAG: flagellar hook-basal body complex protein FliE [Myxococcales bacterium]|nr:flagellar hook-basal body complex protein FliE [Myxococcales bacterium]
MNRIEPSLEASINELLRDPENAKSGTTTDDFSADLQSAIDGVRDNLQSSDQAAANAVVGNGSPHDVMLSLTQAELSFRMITQVRNRLLEAYREIMRMQI